MARVLVTGATGFIGSHLALKLKEKGHEVIGMARTSSSRNMKALDPFLNGVKLVSCDITDYQSVLKVLKATDPEVVVHLAAGTSIPESFDKPFVYVRLNTAGPMNIAYALTDLPNSKKRRLLYASAAAIYGDQKKQPITDDAVPVPQNPYSINKTASEGYLGMLGRLYGLNWIAMRPTNTYGRKLDASFFVEYLITTMLKGDKIYIGQPDVVRDYMHVDDHVNAYVKAIENPDVNKQTFNIGTGVGTANRDLALKIAELVGYDTKKLVFGEFPAGYMPRPFDSDQPKMILDCSRIKKQLGWKAEITLDKGLEKCIDFWKNKAK